MESVEISENNLNNKQIVLSKDMRIKGILFLEGIKKIKINDKIQHDLKMLDDLGEILEFNIKNKELYLFVEWINYSPKKPKEEYSRIEIEAETLYWKDFQ